MPTARQTVTPRTERAPKRRRRVPRTEPALVVNVSLLDPSDDYDEQVSFLGREVRIVRAGTSGRVEEALALVDEVGRRRPRRSPSPAWHEARATGQYRRRPAEHGGAAPHHDGVPVTHGETLRNVLQEWAVRHVQSELPGYFNNARVVVLGGENHEPATRMPARVHRQHHRRRPAAARPARRARVRSASSAGSRARVCGRPTDSPAGCSRCSTRPGPVGRAFARRAARECDVIVATYEELMEFGLEDLSGKTVITAAISDDRLAELARPRRRHGARQHAPAVPRHRRVGRAGGADAPHLVRTPRGSRTTSCSTRSSPRAWSPACCNPTGRGERAASPLSSTRCPSGTSRTWSRCGRSPRSRPVS